MKGSLGWFASPLLVVLLGAMAKISTTVIATCGSVTAPLPDVPGLLAQGRTELKYSVPGPIADAALHVARGYLRPDAFALGPQQLITSLYLDTAHLTFLRWHRERVVDRFKLRIRRYGDHSAATLYAEVKRKTASSCPQTPRGISGRRSPRRSQRLASTEHRRMAGRRQLPGRYRFGKAGSFRTRHRWKNSCAIDRDAAPCLRCLSPAFANRCATRRMGPP